LQGRGFGAADSFDVRFYFSFEGVSSMQYKKLSLAALFSLLALGVSNMASAHEGDPYILPFQFHTDHDVATLYAGDSERYFEPEDPGGAAEGGYAFTVTNPKGETNHVEHISRHKQLVLLEIDTREKGTYKVERTLLSRVFPQVLRQGRAIDVYDDVPPERRKELAAEKVKDGEVQFLYDDELKPGEAVEEVRFANQIFTYVTRETPSTPKLSGKGFEFDFKTHPNKISVQSGLKFIALVDGKPAPGVTFDVRQQGVDEPVRRVKSNPAGLVDLHFAQAGLYVLSAQAPLESVRGGKIVNPRYINWLVVEVRE
jgi:hypothetical protein